MKHFLLLIAALPVLLFAQPEKVRAGITLDEFLAICPNAPHDWEIEGHLIDIDTVQGRVKGRATWQYYNDTIRNYEFKSAAEYAPCAEYTKGDSAKVHGMKVELEKVRILFEKTFGKPTISKNIPLMSVGPATDQLCYQVVWVFGDHKSAHLTITNDDTPKNQMNAPVNSLDRTAGIYTMEIYIDSRNSFFKNQYGVGSSVEEFAEQFPQLEYRLIFEDNMPAFSIADTGTCENAEWAFDFDGQKMFSYMYAADYGTGYGAATDSIAYNKLHLKTEQLIEQMTALYGQPWKVENNLVPEYTPHDKKLSYEREWTSILWRAGNSSVELTFVESGGGKNEHVTFSIFLDWSQI